jgi:gliding motility-associated-like protein
LKNYFNMKINIIPRSFVFAIFSLSFTTGVYSQLLVSTGQTPQWYVENVLLSNTGGVTVSNVTYVGHPDAIGQFTTGSNPTNLGITEGIVMSTGRVNGTPPLGSPVGGFVSTNNQMPGDPLLASLISGITHDAAILEFDFFPLSDTIRFRYVFGSEEYPEFVGTGFNDVFGFFISGPNPLGGTYTNFNIARIPGTTLPVSINNVHSGSYAQYFVNNQGLAGQTIVFDGFTTVLTAWAKVTPCVNYHIKIAIADVGDFIYDSAVFLEANSFGTNAFTVFVDYSVPSVQGYALEGCVDAIVNVNLPQPLTNDFILHYNIAGSAINGVDYLQIPDSIIIPAGQTQGSVVISPIYDGLVEPTEDVLLIFMNTCMATDTIQILIRDYVIPTVTGYGDISFCESAASLVQIGATVFDGHPPFQFDWDNGAGGGQNVIVSPATTTTYTVTVTDLCGYQAYTSVTVTVNPDPDLTLTANPPGVCAGESTVLTATGADMYIWTNLGVSTNPVTVTPLTTTTYILMGTTNTGCFTIDSVTVPVNPSPTVEFTAFPMEGCVPLAVQFDETSPDTDITTWFWTFGNGQTSSLANPMFTYNTPGDYDVSLTLTNSYNCVSVLSYPGFIGAWPQPVADFYTIPEIGKTYEPTISFHSSNISQYWLWHFGDGDSSMSPPVVYHTYPSNEGIYQVTLIVYNDDGCNDTITKMVVIIDDVLVFPNVITPNRDGKNDLLVIENADKYPNNLLQVFNRWGKKVFEQQNYNNKWDGGNLADGTYYYVFFYLDKVHQSSLTIIRE